MADSASFLISLEEKISGSAKKGATSLGELDAQIKRDSSSLKTLESAMKRLEKSGGASEERMASLKGAIDAKKSSIASATNSIADMGAANDNATASTSALGEKIAALGGPIGIAIAVATALAAALFVVGRAMVSMALESAGAALRQHRLAEAMTGSAATATDMVAATYRVAGSSALATSKVSALGDELAKAGLSGSTYETSLKNLADVAVVAGDQAVAPLKEIIAKSQQLGHLKFEGDQLKGTGLQAREVFAELSKSLGIGIDEVEARLKEGKISAEDGIAALNSVMATKFGALGAAALLDFDTQIQKAKDNVGGLFRDVRIEPFLEGLKSLLSLLDEGSATGRVMRGILTGAMDGFFAAAGAALPYVKNFLVGIAIGALRAYIAIKPAIAALGEVFGSGDDKSTTGLDAMATAGKAVGAVLGMVAKVVLVLVAIGAAIYASWSATAAVFGAVGSALGAVGVAISGAFTAAVDYLSGLDFGSIASDLIDGLVDGIASGTGLVISAISGLGSSAIGALKSTLGIASPSKVFKGLGMFTAEGFAGGVDSGAAKVATSVETMVQAPTTIAAPNVVAKAGGSGSKAGGGSSIIVEAGAIVVQIDGSENPKAVAADVRAELQDWLDDLAIQSGAPIGEAA